MKTRNLLIFISALVIFFGSCKDKGNETDFNPNVNSSKDYVYAEDILFEVIGIYLKGIKDSTVINTSYAFLDDCDIIYDHDQSYMRFSYGAVNRWCADNKFRRGKFMAYFDGELFQVGSKASIITDSLFVDDEMVDIEMNMEFLGPGSGTKYQFSFAVDSGMITKDDTVNLLQIYFRPNYILTWEEGEQTPEYHYDDVFSVTGSASGTSIGKTNFEITVVDPLVFDINCAWIVSGMHEIKTPGADVESGQIDYIMEDNCHYQVNFFFDGSEFYEYLKY